MAALSSSSGNSYDVCLQQLNAQYCHPGVQQHLLQLAQQGSQLKFNLPQPNQPSLNNNNLTNNNNNINNNNNLKNANNVINVKKEENNQESDHNSNNNSSSNTNNNNNAVMAADTNPLIFWQQPSVPNNFDHLLLQMQKQQPQAPEQQHLKQVLLRDLKNHIKHYSITNAVSTF